MNNLKFRAWHKEHKRYYLVLQLLLDLETLLLNDLSDAFECCLDEVIIEQYTGLKDKNDKEIYEGDILNRSEYYKYPGMNVEYNRIVERRGSMFILCYERYGKYRDQLYDFDLQNEKIIGNIHENKELL